MRKFQANIEKEVKLSETCNLRVMTTIQRVHLAQL